MLLRDVRVDIYLNKKIRMIKTAVITKILHSYIVKHFILQNLYNELSRTLYSGSYVFNKRAAVLTELNQIDMSSR